MIPPTRNLARDTCRRLPDWSRRPALAGAIAALAILAGCAANPATAPAVAPGPDVAVPSDPIAAFAATAMPGAQSRILLADGQPADVRMVRRYQAASGRECREVLVGSGMAQRAQLVCQGESGWASARPLLPGAGAGRP